MTLREVLNLTAFCAGLMALLTLLFKAGDHPGQFGFSGAEGLYYVTCIVPWILLMVTGEAYGIAFAVSFYYGGGGRATRGYSRERAFVREGRGREVAHALLWRDRLVGDVPGLMAVVEFAQQDADLKPEALRAALRLLGRRRLSRADRDHVGRLLMLAKISVVQATQKPHR
jgi:hypothetical protein